MLCFVKRSQFISIEPITSPTIVTFSCREWSESYNEAHANKYTPELLQAVLSASSKVKENKNETPLLDRLHLQLAKVNALITNCSEKLASLLFACALCFLTLVQLCIIVVFV